METVPTLHHPKPNGNWLLLIAYILAAVILFLLNSCSCDYHLNRAKSKCGYTMKRDTVYRYDTTFVRESRKDTVFHYLQKDTVIVHEGRLTMKYFYNTHDSTIYLNGKCDTVFIVKKVPVEVNTTEIKESWLKYLPVLIAFVIAIITYKFIKKHGFS